MIDHHRRKRAGVGVGSFKVLWTKTGRTAKRIATMASFVYHDDDDDDDDVS